MGRSSASCFKIIACGSSSTTDSADNDHTQLPPPESKSDKRGWSFRKRSSSHRVLSNTVQAASLNKENTEIVTTNLQTQPKEISVEKPSTVSWPEPEEIPQPAAVISKASDATVASEKEKLNIMEPDESNIVVIQAAIRGFLAKRQTLKVKNVVKLQAAVRGHLVRSHAVGTLRCVQAIVKMQGLVRARQARLSSEAKPLDQKASVTKPPVSYISIEKLLSNKFAHQLLESTPKTTRINIKCDPSSRSDSAWNWLERWMSVSSPEADLNSPSEAKSTDAKAVTVETAGVDQISLTSDSDSSSKSDDLDNAQHSQISAELISHETKTPHPVSEIEPKIVSDKPHMEIEQHAKSVKRSAPEEVEQDGKRFAFGTRKATNPAFIAARSKFNESSTTPSLESETISSSMGNQITRDVDLEENPVSHGSQCGTELSVTSTLDSPDRSDTGVVDAEQEIELKKEGSSESAIFKDVHDEAKADPVMKISNSISIQPEKLDSVDGADAEESAISVTTVASKLEKMDPETKESKAKVDVSMEAEHQASTVSSALASPKSQMTVPEFQVTPSSQASVKAKRTKGEKSTSSQKIKSSSAGKSSPLNLNHDSGSKNSMDGFPKDLKKSKRRDSFGSGRSDYAEQEPRDSSSSNPLPSYMQATASAKAKTLANSSPMSSPDVQEKDVYVKKRYSLPGGNGKTNSPRLQSSKSQGQLGAKANGNPQERKWQR